MKITAKDVKEITYMPLVTFFSVLEVPGKNRTGGCNNPPWLDEGEKKPRKSLFGIFLSKINASIFKNKILIK